MSWFSELFAGGAADVVEKVEQTVDRFQISGEEKNQFKLELKQIITQRESNIEKTIRSNLEEKERIIVAELQQGDKFTKRARPTVVYFGLVMIALNYFLLPAALLISGNSDKLETCTIKTSADKVIEKSCVKETLFPLPIEFWMAWGGIVATWAVGRSYEKANASNAFSRLVTGVKKRSSLLDDETVG